MVAQFPAIDGVTDVELAPGVTIGVRFLGLRAIARWDALHRTAQFDELRRLAALRRSVPAEDLPELHKTLSPEGERLRQKAIELVGLVGGLAAVLAKDLETRGAEGAAEMGAKVQAIVEDADKHFELEPYRTTEYLEADAAIGRVVLGDAVAYVRGLRFGEVDSDGQTEPAAIVDMLERSGYAQGAIRVAMGHQRPTARQAF